MSLKVTSYMSLIYLNTQFFRLQNHRNCRFIIRNMRQRYVSLTSFSFTKKQKTIIVAQKMVIVENE